MIFGALSLPLAAAAVDPNEYMVNLESLNDSGVTGTAWITVTDTVVDVSGQSDIFIQYLPDCCCQFPAVIGLQAKLTDADLFGAFF